MSDEHFDEPPFDPDTQEPPRPLPQMEHDPLADDEEGEEAGDDDAGDSGAANLTRPNLKAIIKCVHVGLDDASDSIVAVVKFKQSKHEEGMRITLKLKAEGEGLMRRFRVGQYYAVVLKDAPMLDGEVTNLKLDDEHVSVVLECAHLGRARPMRKDGERVAVLGFTDSLDAEHSDQIRKASLLARVEGLFHLDRFDLDAHARLAIVDAPDWVYSDTAPGASVPFDQTPLGKAMDTLAEAPADAEASLWFAADYSTGTITTNGETRDLTAEELENAMRNIKKANGGTLPEPGKKYTLASDEPTDEMDSVVIAETGRVVAFIDTDEDRALAKSVATRVTDTGTHTVYLIPEVGETKWQKSPAQSADQAEQNAVASVFKRPPIDKSKNKAAAGTGRKK